jgi:hypothetical protein
VWANPVPDERVGPAVDLETVAAAEAAAAKSGESATRLAVHVMPGQISCSIPEEGWELPRMCD